jgi:polar amino acid transport system substrate-binding protein
MKCRRPAFVLFVAVLALIIGGVSQLTAQESTLDKVLKAGKLTVAVFSDVPPIGFLDEKNQPTGIDVDVATAMAKALGVKIEFVATTNANRIPYLLTNKVDCVVASFTMNPERRKVIEYSNVYFRGGAILVVNSKSAQSANIKTIGDLKGKSIAVSKGSFNDEIITGLAGNTAKSIVRFENVSDLYQSLKSGKVDAMVEDVVLAGYMTKTQYPELKVAGNLLSNDLQGIGVRRGDQIWLNWINGFLMDLCSSGQMKDICAKYGVTYSQVNFPY